MKGSSLKGSEETWLSIAIFNDAFSFSLIPHIVAKRLGGKVSIAPIEHLVA